MKIAAAMLFMLVIAMGPPQTQTYEAVYVKAMEQWKAKDYPNAEKSFDRLYQMARDSHDLDKQYDMLGWLGSASDILGDTTKSLAYSEERLTLLRQNRQHFQSEADDEEELLHTLGSLYLEQGNYPLAIKDLRASLAICQAPMKDCGTSTGRIMRDLGIGMFFSGDAKSAEQVLRDSVKSLHAFSAQVLPNPSAAPTTDLEIETLRWLERVLVTEHRTDEALEVSQRCRAGGLSQALTTRLGAKFSEATTAPTAIQLKSIAHEENATLVEYSIVYKTKSSVPLEFSDFEMLPAAELYVWVIHPSGKIDFRQTSFGPAGLQLAALVKDVRNSITGSHDTGARTKALQRAYQAFIQPIEGLLPADPQAPILFVPQDTLYLLPFAALEDAKGKYLIEKHTIASEISLEVLELSRKQLERLPKQSMAMIASGNPIPPAGYPSLPGAEKEAGAVASVFSATPLTGAQATKAALMRRAGNARILHLATHGIINAKEGQLSALALSPEGSDPGLLSGVEVQAMTLPAELAVLSACDTGQGNITGDGVLGIGRSFVAAGVPTLIVSLWSIPDSPTAALMTEFYRNLRLGGSKAQALRTAMLNTMKQYPEPKAWAAFTILGVPEASPLLRAVHGNADKQVTEGYAPIFTLPYGAHDYVQQSDRQYDFSSSLSLTELAKFYRRAFHARGYREKTSLASVEKETFSVVFEGPRKGEILSVQGTDIQGVRVVTVGVEAAR
jgi:CHAT domain-containing protein